MQKNKRFIVFSTLFMLSSCATVINLTERPDWSFRYYQKDGKYLYFTGRSDKRKIKEEKEAFQEAEIDCYRKAEGYFNSWLELRLIELKYSNEAIADAINIENIQKNGAAVFSDWVKYKKGVRKSKDGKKNIPTYESSRFLKTADTKRIQKEQKYVYVYLKQRIEIDLVTKVRNEAVTRRINLLKNRLGETLNDPAEREKTVRAIAVLETFIKS